MLDEADRMLEMGFRDDILGILNYLPIDRQNVCVSATLNKNLAEFTKKIFNASKNPIYIENFNNKDNEKQFTASELYQSFIIVSASHRFNHLFNFLKVFLNFSTLIAQLAFEKDYWTLE